MTANSTNELEGSGEINDDNTPGTRNEGGDEMNDSNTPGTSNEGSSDINDDTPLLVQERGKPLRLIFSCMLIHSCLLEWFVATEQSFKAVGLLYIKMYECIKNTCQV